MHHRTARGTLKISCSKNDEGKTCLSGSVEMDPCMERLDVIPFGGDFSFEETCRLQRFAYQEYARETTTTGSIAAGDWHPTPYEKVSDPKPSKSTGVIKIIVSKPPDGLQLFQSSLKETCKFRGELRIFDKKTAAGYLEEPDKWSDGWPVSAIKFDNVNAALELLSKHYEQTCSWLHVHTILPKEVTSVVGEFLCPPPVFFFERGDVCIDMDWTCGLNNEMANTCIIARRRRGTGNSAKVITSHQDRYQRDVTQYDKAIEDLKLERDLIHFAYLCFNKVNSSGNLRLEFLEDTDDSTDFHLAKRCLVWMKKDFFQDQLAKYGLQLEHQERFFIRDPWCCLGYRLIFSWLPK